MTTAFTPSQSLAPAMAVPYYPGDLQRRGAVRAIPPTEHDDLPADLGDNVMRAISLEIARIATLSEKTPSMRAFFLISKLANMARDIKNLDLSVASSCAGNSSWDYPAAYPQYPGQPLAPAPQAETFGVNAIREVVAAASQRKPVEIVAAIAEAKKAGLHDLARSLRAQLNVGDEPEPKPKRARTKTTRGNKVVK